MSNVSYQTINSLSEISFIGGSEYTITFNVFDQNGGAANISGATCSWKMSPYGEPETVILSYNGTPVGTTAFSITILAADTLALSGKFIHQPLVVESGKSYRSQQGIITIIPAIN